MNALILGNFGQPDNTTAWVNDLVMEDVIVTRFSNNALGMNSELPSVGSNWQINRTTFYGHYNKQNMGSLSLQSNASADEHFISNSINVFGRSEFPDGNVVLNNNCEFNMYTGSINGNIEDPQFRSIERERDIFENDLSVDFATVFTEDYTPLSANCADKGSRLTSVNELIFNPQLKLATPSSGSAQEGGSNQNAEGSNSDATAPQQGAEATPASNGAIADSSGGDNSSGSDGGEGNSDSALEGETEDLFIWNKLTPEEQQLFVILFVFVIIFSILLLILIYLAWNLRKQSRNE